MGMAISHGVLFGIGAMIGYGLADFFVERATRDESAFTILLWSKVVSVGILGVALVARSLSLSMGGADAVLLGSAGVLSVAAYLALYRGIAVGKLSLVSPVASAWGAVTAILGVVVLGQVLTGIQTVAVAVVVAGTVLASFRWHDLRGLRWREYEVGIEYGAVALVAWGISFTLIDVAIGSVGWLPAIFTVLLVLLLTLAGYGLVVGRDLGRPNNGRSTALIGVCEAAAYVALGIGLTDFDAALVGPVAAAFPIVTVLLARVFLDEPLDTNQWAGIGGIIVAVVLLSL